MSERKADDRPADSHAEPFLERWSRRKTQARSGPVDEPVTATEADGDAEVGATPAPAAPAVELPDVDDLGEDSDYSAFLAPGVDEALRRRALRKLFSSPKFNVLDGLDDYNNDFTQFEALGDIVTADVRLQLERAARAAGKALEPGTPAVVAQGGEPAPKQAAPAAGPAPSESDDGAIEEHDSPDRTA